MTLHGKEEELACSSKVNKGLSEGVGREGLWTIREDDGQGVRVVVRLSAVTCGCFCGSLISATWMAQYPQRIKYPRFGGTNGLSRLILDPVFSDFLRVWCRRLGEMVDEKSGHM